MQVLLQKMKDLENINQKLNNVDNYLFNIPNANIIYEITNKYIKVLCLFLLNRLYIYSTTDFIPLIIKNSKKGVNFDKSSSPQESLILVALFQSISSLFIEINYDKIQNNKCDESFIMLDILFSEYVNNEIDIDTSTLGSLNELLIKDLRSYLSSDLNNCLSKEKKKISIIGNIKKVFLYNCFDIDNYIDNDFCIKQMIKSKIISNLIQRYLFVLISYFIYYRKSIDCLKYFNEFYLKYNNAVKPDNKYKSYFDVDSIKEIIDKNAKLNLNKNVKNYLVEEYIYSDVQLMNFYDQFWQINANSKNNFIKNYFEIMSNNKYMSRKIDNIFKKNEIILLINSIFELNEQNNDNDISINTDNNSLENETKNKKDELLKSFGSILIRAIYMISESINNTLVSDEINNKEIDIKSNLSKFSTIYNILKKNNSLLNGNNYTLFIIPMISTILIFTQHLLKFKERQNITNSIKKINEILEIESSGLMLKSFSLSLWINLIQKISERHINFEIDKYIEMINSIISQIVEAYHKSQLRVFSMQMYTNKNYNNFNEIQEKEYFEIINDYLESLNIFAKNNPTLLIKNYSILNELFNILNIQFYYPPKLRIQFIEIINLLINHIKKGSHQINKIIAKEKNLDNNDEDEIMLNALNDNNLIDSIFNENEENINFYKFAEDKILPNIKQILSTFVSTENTNVMTKKKILFPLYEENALLYANIFGILIKNKIKKNHLEYPSYIFNSYYNNKDDKNNILDSVFQNCYSNVNHEEKICYIKLPFKLLAIYLDYYQNLLNEIIKNDSFNFIIKYYLELFFIGLFINNKNKNNFFNYEVKYCEKIFKIIKGNKELLLQEKENIIKEFNINTFISDEDKTKICLINIMIVLANINEEGMNIETKDFNTMVIGELLAKLSLNFNIDKVDSEIFFELINGQRTKIALNKINKLSNFSNTNNNLETFNENEFNVRLYILSKYQEEYIRSQLNNKFTSYIDDFIKVLTGEELISSIITLNFVNNLLTGDKNISNKFQICLKKVFNALISKASCLSNILSLKEKNEKIKEDFSNKEMNNIISGFIGRYHGNINLKNNIYNLDISFKLKDNIINSFISDLALNNYLSSNIYTNLLKYIYKSNNNYSYNKQENSYYEEAIYYYLSLCNILDKEKDIKEIIKSITNLFETMEKMNNYMINYIYDLKSFYVFIFFLEKINFLISSIIRIEDLETLNNPYNSSLLDDKLLSQNFLKKVVKIIECFCSFLYQYIIQIIKGYSFNDNYVHSFIYKKMMSIWNKKTAYFNNNRNFDETNNFINEYLKEKYGKSIMIKGFKLIEKMTNNIKIY